MKVCTGCKELKTANKVNFYLNKRSKDGYDFYCKECRKEFRKIDYFNKIHGTVKKVETRKCNCCEEEKPLTAEHWHYLDKKNKTYKKICKVCTQDRQKLLRDRKKKKEEYLIRKKEEEKEKLEFARAKEIEEIYQNILRKELYKDKQLGLQIQTVNLKIGNKYKIIIPVKPDTQKTHHNFIGELIQECDRHYIFKNKNGRCESFLKVDLLLDYEYKEVN